MPQLDTVTYFTQVFWLIIVFIVLYVVITTRYLPKLALILKYRSLYDYERNAFIRILYEEIKFEQIQDFTITHINTTKTLSSEITKEVDTWYQESLKQLQEEELEPTNITFIETQAMYPAYNYAKQEILAM